MDIILATRNPAKVVQIGELFSGSTIRILSLDAAGIKGAGKELRDSTLDINAHIKADYAHNRRPDLYCVADDTGIFIRALDGLPGADAAVWAGEGVSETVTMNYCLAQMKGKTDRYAVFRVVVIAISPKGEVRTFEGKLEGSLLKKPRVDPRPGKPYSPLFVPEGEHLSLAEMNSAYENEISHRGQAFRKLRAFLEGLESRP